MSYDLVQRFGNFYHTFLLLSRFGSKEPVFTGLNPKRIEGSKQTHLLQQNFVRRSEAKLLCCFSKYRKAGTLNDIFTRSTILYLWPYKKIALLRLPHF